MFCTLQQAQRRDSVESIERRFAETALHHAIHYGVTSHYFVNVTHVAHAQQHKILVFKEQ